LSGVLGREVRACLARPSVNHEKQRARKPRIDAGQPGVYHDDHDEMSIYDY